MLPALDSTSMMVPQRAGGTYVSSLTNGTEYTFTVKTVDTSGNKSAGVTVKATPEAGETLKIALTAEVPHENGYAGNKSNTKVTVTVNITTASTVKKVVWKKEGSLSAKTLLADTEATAATVSNDNAKWTFDITATNESANGIYTVAAIDEAGREETEQIKIDNFDFTPEGFARVAGNTITGSETWTPSSRVFVSGRSLTIPNLYVCDHEVTRGEYKAIMGTDPSIASAYDKDGNKLTGDAVLNNPVNYVSWYDALVYCNRLSIKEGLTPCYTISNSTDPDTWGSVPTSNNSTWDASACNFEADGYRLATEAEWEWLARGGENYTYAGSDRVEDVAWYTSNTKDTGSREVKTKKANAYGLYDMSGNVYEWCWDWYGSISSSIGASGASSGDGRVVRGGSWFSSAYYCEVAVRNDNNNPDYRSKYYGFRVVRTVQ